MYQMHREPWVFRIEKESSPLNSVSISENGWTDAELAMQWMTKDFEPQTREKANGETRVLFMDGHSSHYSSELLDFCTAHNIMILGYPPHCTHALQGLDVVCFTKHKEEWKAEIDAFEQRYFRGVNKVDFVEVFGKAYLCAFTRETVEAAWKATGLIPFNQDVITAQQMKPAEVTSTKTTFPLAQNSPTRAVMAAFRDYNFTYRDIHPDSSPIAGPSNFPGSPSSPAPQMTPSRNPFPTTRLSPTSVQSTSQHPRSTDKRRRDPAADPSLMTPSKRMRFLGNGLASTSSGSFLLTKAKTTHLQMSHLIKPPVLEATPSHLPRPNWSILKPNIPMATMSPESLLRHSEELVDELRKACILIQAYDAIIEGQNAQLVVRNMGIERMSATLHAKEDAKKTDRTILFPGGKGRHLTGAEFWELKSKQEADKLAKDAAVASRAIQRSQKRLEKQKIELAWKRIQQENTEAIEAHKEECKRLRDSGTRAKDLPKGPGRGRLRASVTVDDYRESDGVVGEPDGDGNGERDDDSGDDLD